MRRTDQERPAIARAFRILPHRASSLGTGRAPMTITVHHLENSRSQRILWLLEELGLRL